MPCIDTPIVLLTRPFRDSERFVDSLRAIATPFEAIISPAFEIEPIRVELPSFDTAIFTSRIGVVHAPFGNGCDAFCVGDATATVAKAAGYVPISANGSADDLVALILNQKPSGALLHIRGENSRGDVTNRLKQAGLNCKDAIAYRKTAAEPSQALVAELSKKRKTVLPLFSAETVSILGNWKVSFEGINIVAISGEVGRAATVLDPASIIISDAPNMREMAQAVARLIT